MVKVDVGCGTKKKEGYIGVDILKFDGVDIVMDAGKDPWPWKDGEVDEIHCSHFVEHLTAEQRVHFVNEAHRVLKPKGTCLVIVPHWASLRAYGDLTHQWPPVSEMWFYYLNKEWREREAPHNNMYTCDFDATWGYGLDPALAARNQEYQQYAAQWFKNACSDIVATLTKRG